MSVVIREIWEMVDITVHQIHDWYLKCFITSEDPGTDQSKWTLAVAEAGSCDLVSAKSDFCRDRILGGMGDLSSGLEMLVKDGACGQYENEQGLFLMGVQYFHALAHVALPGNTK